MNHLLFFFYNRAPLFCILPFFFYCKKSLFYTLRSDSAMASQSEKTQGSIHDFTVEDARGNDVDLSTYKGKVLLIVNVASRCGLTNSNYTQLNQLYEKYKNQDFEILAFPCNQFGSEEPGDNEQILDFVCTRFKSKFPIFDKVDVNGNNATPVYKFLKSSKGGIFGDSIKWNFAKFLVDKDGHVVGRYAPTTSPLRIEKGIKKLLGVFRTRNKCIREDPLADDVAQEPERSTVPEHDLCETWLYLSEDEETTLDHS